MPNFITENWFPNTNEETLKQIDTFINPSFFGLIAFSGLLLPYLPLIITLCAIYKYEGNITQLNTFAPQSLLIATAFYFVPPIALAVIGVVSAAIAIRNYGPLYEDLGVELVIGLIGVDRFASALQNHPNFS